MGIIVIKKAPLGKQGRELEGVTSNPLFDYNMACIKKAKEIKGLCCEPIPFLKRLCGMCLGIFMASGVENRICPSCLSQWNAGEIELEVF